MLPQSMPAVTVAITPEEMELLGDRERTVGRDGRHGDLDHGIVDAPDDTRRRKACRRAHRDAESDDLREFERTGSAIPVSPPLTARDDDCEQNDASAVVDEALAFDEKGRRAAWARRDS